MDCASLVGRKAGAGVVEKAAEVAKGQKIGSNPFVALPAPRSFCRLQARLTPAAGSDIRVEVWLPDAAGWNGKLLGSGNGGFGGSIEGPYFSMYPALARGYATAGTDMGHETPAGQTTARWAYGHRQKLIDWAYRANHLTALFAKAMILAYYGSGTRKSYFQGCSDGGREALMEALRFPDDYDGIISGAPASPWTRQMTDFVWDDLAVHGTPGADLSDADLKLLHKAVLARCGAFDGVKDGIVSYPPACHFDPAVLLCKPGQHEECFNRAQVSAVRKIFRGARMSDGQQISSGFPPGSEANWKGWITGPKAQQPQFGIQFYRWMVYGEPSWIPAHFDFARDYALAERRVGWMIDSDRPDLSAFMRRGGKLILYQGWADPAISPGNIIAYYEALTKNLGAAADQVRLFMVPGMSHCLGGDGPNVFDTLGALNQWVEHGVAPKRLIASKYEGVMGDVLAYLGHPEKPVMTRPLCAWPKRAHWNGTGSTNEAASFVCATPKASSSN